MWFSRKKKEREALDRLHKMTENSWRCGTCNQDHIGLMDLAMSSPSVWKNEEVIEDNSALRMEGDFLSEDFCVIEGESFIVRCVLEIPVEGLETPFGFGVWSSLSKDNFLKYLEDFDEGIQSEGSAWSSWFCSHLGYFGKTVGEKAWVIPRLNRQRPLVTLMNTDSVLGRSQTNGLAASALIEILEYYGNYLPSET